MAKSTPGGQGIHEDNNEARERSGSGNNSSMMINKFLCEVLRTLALLSFFVAVVFVCVLTWSEHNPEVRRALLDIQTVLFSDILGMY